MYSVARRKSRYNLSVRLDEASRRVEAFERERKVGKKKVENNLRKLRKTRCLTQTEVAKVLDMSLSTVCRHEGSSRGLDRDTIEKYAGLYKVSAAEIFVDLPIESDD